MNTWLVTGGTGFLGRHVMARIGAHAGPDDRIVSAGRGDLNLCDADITDRYLSDLQPDVVLHLAGLTPPAPSSTLYQANVIGTLHLLDGLKRLGRRTRVVLAGSAAELGPVPPESVPTAETYEPHPATPYGLSKHLATQAGLSMRSPLDVIGTRLFNITGPGAPAGQAFGRFAAELARAPQGSTVTLNVGPLEPRRDFVDVRDAADALLRLATLGLPRTVYHVGTGESRSVVEGLARLIDLSSRDVRIQAAPTTHPDDSRADATRLRRDTGWEPRHSFERTIADLWRAAVEAT